VVDVQRFVREVPGLFRDWGKPSARAVSDRFAQVLQRVRGMTTPGVLQLLNHAVGCLEAGEAYVEVGCFQGATLIGALLGHSQCPAYAADNFSEFDPRGENERALRGNLEAFGLSRQVHFRRQHFEPFLRELGQAGVRAGVYLYDGAHDYRSQLLGLLLAVPLLAPRALLVVDDSNFPAVKQATWDFLAIRPECRLLLELPTPGNGDPTFWNGLYVLGWEAGSDNGYDAALLGARRQQALLTSLDVLQEVNPLRDGQRILVSWTG
jgi:hypothetical protein